VKSLLVSGWAIWTAATLVLWAAGERIVPAHAYAIVILYFGSAGGCAGFARLACQRAHLPRSRWAEGAILLLLPTLLFDPFSAAFFHFLVPGAPDRAGAVFGGWMLSCCAGALLSTMRVRLAPGSEGADAR
jgi:hypothetical protein